MPSKLKTSNTTRFILLAGVISVVIWMVLTTISPEFAYERSNDSMPTATYFAIHLMAFSIMTGLGWGLFKKAHSSRFQLGLLVGFAVLFRLILIPSTPIHESDFYRYQWDGKVAKTGINPFLYEPEALSAWDGASMHRREFTKNEEPVLRELARLRDENPALFERISHKSVTTIYPPVAQALFWTSSVLFGDSLIGLKAIIIVFDIGVIFLVIGLLRVLDKNPLGVIFYAWNPLVLKEFANSAHYDSLPIFFTVLAVFLAVKSQKRGGASLALAAGTLAKFFSILLIPVLIVKSPLKNENGWRDCFRSLLPALGIVLAVTAAFTPYFIWNNAGFDNVFSGLRTYNARWEYNAGLFAVFRNLLPFSAAKILSATLLVMIIAILTFIPTRNKTHLVQKAAIVIGVLFILSPTAFPWYFAWVLPFTCLFPRPSWIVLGALLPVNYLDFHSATALPFAHTTFWQIPWLSWICWGVFVIIFFLETIIHNGHIRPNVSST